MKAASVGMGGPILMGALGRWMLSAVDRWILDGVEGGSVFRDSKSPTDTLDVVTAR